MGEELLREIKTEGNIYLMLRTHPRNIACVDQLAPFCAIKIDDVRYLSVGLGIGDCGVLGLPEGTSSTLKTRVNMSTLLFLKHD